MAEKLEKFMAKRRELSDKERIEQIEEDIFWLLESGYDRLDMIKSINFELKSMRSN